MAERFGSKKTLIAGIALEVAGLVTCAVFGDYFGLLIGNVLVGAGLGLINVTCNALAAMADGTEAVAQAFADVMAGILSASGRGYSQEPSYSKAGWSKCTKWSGSDSIIRQKDIKKPFSFYAERFFIFVQILFTEYLKHFCQGNLSRCRAASN